MEKIVSVKETKLVEDGVLKMNAGSCVSLIFVNGPYGVMSHLFYPHDCEQHLEEIKQLISQLNLPLKDFSCFIAGGSNGDSVYKVGDKNLQVIREKLGKKFDINEICVGGNYSRKIVLDTRERVIKVLKHNGAGGYQDSVNTRY